MESVTLQIKPDDMTGPAILLRYFLLILLLLTYVTAYSADYRAEVQFGVNTGDTEVGGVTDLFFEVEGTDFDSDTGNTFGAQFWVDNYPGNFSIGLQYMRLTDADYGGNRTEFCIFCVPDTTEEHYSPEIDAVMVNFLLRDHAGTLINERLHPYIGAGLGASWVDVDAVIITTTGTGTTTITGSDDATGLAGQLMVGIDYDITEKIYLGLNASYFATYVDLFNDEHDFEKFIGMATLGYKF